MKQSTYRFLYAGKRYTLAQAEQLATWANLHPEPKRRAIAMLEDCPYDLGVGSAWRSLEAADKEFRKRYDPHASYVPGSIYYAGLYWTLKPGNAPLAPPGRGYHNSVEPFGYCLAIDWLNGSSDAKAIKWVGENSGLYGFFNFSALSGKSKEPWHDQVAEVPVSRSQYRPNTHTLTYWPLPNREPVPTPPTPPIKVKDDDMMFAAKLDTNPNLLMVGNMVDMRCVRASYVDEFLASVEAGCIDIYDISKPDHPRIANRKDIPVVNVDTMMLLGNETDESYRDRFGKDRTGKGPYPL